MKARAWLGIWDRFSFGRCLARWQEKIKIEIKIKALEEEWSLKVDRAGYDERYEGLAALERARGEASDIHSLNRNLQPCHSKSDDEF